MSEVIINPLHASLCLLYCLHQTQWLTPAPMNASHTIAAYIWGKSSPATSLSPGTHGLSWRYPSLCKVNRLANLPVWHLHIFDILEQAVLPYKEDQVAYAEVARSAHHGEEPRPRAREPHTGHHMPHRTLQKVLVHDMKEGTHIFHDLRLILQSLQLCLYVPVQDTR